MFHCMPGSCQASSHYEDNCASGALKSLHSVEDWSEKHQQKGSESTQLPSEEGNQCVAPDTMHYSLALRGRHLRPLKKASRIRALCINAYHSRCLDFHDKGGKEFSILPFSYKKSIQKSSSQKKRTNSRVDWMTLDGLLVNAVDTTSNEMGKLLGHKELIAWNGFAPLQKVLVVAVTAAAAVAAKQRHTKEMQHLQLAVATRDKECEILREKIIELQEHLSFWKEQAQNFCEDMEANGKEITDSFLLNLGLESTPKCHSMMLEQFATPQLQQATVRMPNHIACFRRNLRSANFRNDRNIRAHSPNGSTWHNDEKSFWDRLSESPSVIEGQLTPQLPFTQLNKISTPSSNPSSKQVGRLSRYCQKGCRRVTGTEDLLASSTPSAKFDPFQKEQLLAGQVKSNDDCRTLDRMDKRIESDQSLTTSDWSFCKSNEGDQTNVDSAFRAAVRNTVDNFWGPVSGRHYAASHVSSSNMVAGVEAGINLLQDSELVCERKTEEAEIQLAESGCHRCKELQTTSVMLKETEKRLASCKEACKKKDKAISKLEKEATALQELVNQLKSLKVTPKVVGQQEPSPVQTFLTSNLLFNLDSPVKFGSPLSAKSSFSSWRGLDELSKVSDSLDRESREGSCESEINRLEQVHAWQTDGNKEEPSKVSTSLDRESRQGSCESGMNRLERVHAWQTDGNKEEQEHILSMLEVDRDTTNKNAIIGEHEEKPRKCSSNEDVWRSGSSTDEPSRKSTGSNTDESGCNSVRNGRLHQLPKNSLIQAKKLKVPNAGNARLPYDNGGRMPPSLAEASGASRHSGRSSMKASNVLASVEPNTHVRERKVNGNSKEKLWSHHSLDSLNKAKENFAHRRRWM